MNKAELLKRWQKAAERKIPGGLSREKHDILLETLCAVIADALLRGGEVPLPYLGKLKVKKTVAREGRNPRTGAVLTIPARRKAVLAEGKSFREALNSGADTIDE